MRLNRDQLASFLKDPRTIREFERLLSTVDELANSDAANLSSGVAMATAQEALAEALAEKIGLLPRVEPFPVHDDLSPQQIVYNFYDDMTPRAEPREAISLLHDVELINPANGEVLTYSGGKWVNQAGGSGGGGYPPQLGYMGWGQS